MAGPGVGDPAATFPGGDRGDPRARLRARLARVDAALRQWEAWEFRQGRAMDTWSAPPPPPTLSPASLTDLRALLLEELARLDAAVDPAAAAAGGVAAVEPGRREREAQRDEPPPG